MKYKGLTVPAALEDYLMDTEQDESEMTLDEWIEEAEHVYNQEMQSKEDDLDGYGSTYTTRQIEAVKKFAEKLKLRKE